MKCASQRDRLAASDRQPPLTPGHASGYNALMEMVSNIPLEALTMGGDPCPNSMAGCGK